MEDDEAYYETWDRIIDLVLVLCGFFIAVILYLGVPHG